MITLWGHADTEIVWPVRLLQETYNVRGHLIKPWMYKAQWLPILADCIHTIY